MSEQKSLWDAVRQRLEAESYGYAFGDVEEAVTTERLSFTLALIDVAEAVSDYIAEPTTANEHRLAVANLQAREALRTTLVADGRPV